MIKSTTLLPSHYYFTVSPSGLNGQNQNQKTAELQKSRKSSLLTWTFKFFLKSRQMTPKACREYHDFKLIMKQIASIKDFEKD